MDWMCLRDFDQITFTYTLIMCYLQTEYVLHEKSLWRSVVVQCGVVKISDHKKFLPKLRVLLMRCMLPHTLARPSCTSWRSCRVGRPCLRGPEVSEVREKRQKRQKDVKDVKTSETSRPFRFLF